MTGRQNDATASHVSIYCPLLEGDGWLLRDGDPPTDDPNLGTVSKYNNQVFMLNATYQLRSPFHTSGPTPPEDGPPPPPPLMLLMLYGVVDVVAVYVRSCSCVGRVGYACVACVALGAQTTEREV